MLIEERKPMRVNLSAEIERQTEEFKRRGGRIDHVPIGRGKDSEVNLSERDRVALGVFDTKTTGDAESRRRGQKSISDREEREAAFQVDFAEWQLNRRKYKYITATMSTSAFCFRKVIDNNNYQFSSRRLADVVKYRDEFCKENGICLA